VQPKYISPESRGHETVMALRREMNQNKKKVALVTGACGGIGQAAVHKFASQRVYA
jgi:FlaA1/EpsC-like NDP-sugar epimerase